MPDLTGTPTSLGIGTYNVDADAPSGLGFNEAMSQIDALIAARMKQPASPVTHGAVVWSGTDWLPATGGDGSGLHFLADDGTYKSAVGGVTVIGDSVAGGSVASFDTNTILGGNIPSTFKHLRGHLYARGDTAAAAVGVGIRINNDSGSNYEYQLTNVSGTTISGGVTTPDTKGQIGTVAANTGTANRFDSIEFVILRYNGTVGHKSIIATGTRHDGAGVLATTQTSTYYIAVPAAVTRITVFPFSGNFIAGSEFTLEGAG